MPNPSVLEEVTVVGYGDNGDSTSWHIDVINGRLHDKIYLGFLEGEGYRKGAVAKGALKNNFTDTQAGPCHKGMDGQKI